MAEARSAHWNFRLDLSALARGFLSKEAGASARTGICQPRIRLDRDQRFVLFAPTSFELSTVVCRHTARIRFQRKGSPLHHAYEEAARRRDTARQLLRFRRPLPSRETGTDPLAVPAQLRVEQRSV